MMHKSSHIIKKVFVGFLFVISMVTRADETSITEAMIITQSGEYVVANDIVGTITVASDNVYININGNIISGGGQGIRIVQQSYCTFENGIIENTQEGVFVNTCTQISIRCITAQTNSKGIVVQATEKAFVDTNILLNNTTSGIETTSCPAAQITNNHFDGNNSSIILQQSDNVYIAYNTSMNNTQDGLSTTSCDNAVILDNKGETSSRSIYMQDSSDCVISRNYCSTCTTGIYLDAGTSNNELSCNRCYNCTTNSYDIGVGNRFVYNIL